MARSLAHKWRKKRCAAPIRHLRDAIELAHPYGAHEWRWCGAGLARLRLFVKLRVADTLRAASRTASKPILATRSLPVGIMTDCDMHKPSLPTNRYGKGWERALVVVAFLLLALPATAAPPPGTDLNSPTHQWFERQHSVAGAWCCDVSDGHLLDDTDWRQSSDHYEVRIGSQWYPIPDTAMRDPRGGPNPTGKAIVWYTDGEAGLRIWCFAPGWEG